MQSDFSFRSNRYYLHFCLEQIPIGLVLNLPNESLQRQFLSKVQDFPPSVLRMIVKFCCIWWSLKRPRLSFNLRKSWQIQISRIITAKTTSMTMTIFRSIILDKEGSMQGSEKYTIAGIMMITKRMSKLRLIYLIFAGRATVYIQRFRSSFFISLTYFSKGSATVFLPTLKLAQARNKTPIVLSSRAQVLERSVAVVKSDWMSFCISP